MPTRHGTARIRSIATELRDLRDKAGLSTREAAKRVGMSASTLNRLENGGKAVEPEDVSALLVVYAVTGVERERLLQLSREANLPGWWETGDRPLPKHLPALISFESEATAIVHVSMLRIPGLLQTADYIREVMSANQVAAPEVEARVAARLGRQSVLTKPRPPQYLVILDEAVLRRPVGGGQLMAEQLRHVVNSARRPNIEVRVIPFARGEHAGVDGTFVVMDFAKARSIVYLEHKRSSLFVDDPDEVRVFHQTTDTLLTTALGSGESLEFLASVADEYSEG
ncbi:Transcriptional regulator, contains XRE-family HTH domain [Amycolatopsis marina]|uniref:Transcriptional regulator, contains XRE-family HTH domain n=1 Tax=Amycolatopsis marina TaxID=490629 RepID=A0A1I1A9C2_9PSEU|nr:helix-turn-helix transcriptional regulator [Amycolatopsis marina]SFB33070.1 Transcriptional regulator, contains XRE-family HTH domain [Amycolatopsis marina]